MNKKTFTLAVIFLLLTLVWFVVNIYWYFRAQSCIFDLIIAIVFVAASAMMVGNEFTKKRRKHIEAVNKNKIP